MVVDQELVTEGVLRQPSRHADGAIRLGRRNPRPRAAFVAPVPVRVLEHDPELAAGLDATQRPLAFGMATAPALEFERGPWTFSAPSQPGALGALILNGLLIVRLEVGSHAHVELLSRGDMISPWVGLAPDLNVPAAVTSKIVSPLRLAMLDRRFALRTARWPEIHACILQRLVTRSRRLSLQSAINGIPRIEERLELTLWQLGDRFGRVTRNGIVVHLPLSHSQLAEMLGAQRPSVSTAAARLARQDRALRLGRDEWLLKGEPPAWLSQLKRQAGLPATSAA